jgi:hypothetical protein
MGVRMRVDDDLCVFFACVFACAHGVLHACLRVHTVFLHACLLVHTVFSWQRATGGFDFGVGVGYTLAIGCTSPMQVSHGVGAAARRGNGVCPISGVRARVGEELR